MAPAAPQSPAGPRPSAPCQRPADQPAIVLGGVDVLEGAGIVHRDVQHFGGVPLDDGTRPGLEGSGAQLAEEAGVEDRRVPVPPQARGAHDRRARGPHAAASVRTVSTDTNGWSPAPPRRPRTRAQPGPRARQQRRELPAFGPGVDDDLEGERVSADRQGDLAGVAAGHDDERADAAAASVPARRARNDAPSGPGRSALGRPMRDEAPAARMIRRAWFVL